MSESWSLTKAGYQAWLDACIADWHELAAWERQLVFEALRSL